MNDIENLIDPEGWQKAQDNNQDDYGGQCVKTAYNLMKRIDDPGVEITQDNVHQLVSDADDGVGGGITGFMAGAVASMVSHFHGRGEEFRRAWNREVQIGDEGDKANEDKGVLNPALMNIG